MIVLVDFLKPTIERRLEDDTCYPRKEIAKGICYAIESGDISEKFYESCGKLLRSDDSVRLLLYLPFDCLKSAPEGFRQIYMSAWSKLLHARDMRKDFHFGDSLDSDARPFEDSVKVAKCAHLIPWLLEYGYIKFNDLYFVLVQFRGDAVLLQSFRDTFGYIREKGLLTENELRQLDHLTEGLPERKLFNCNRSASFVALTPRAKLQGPFSSNAWAFTGGIEEIKADLRPDEIVLIGGSPLKGYSSVDSELAVWDIDQLIASNIFSPGVPEMAHIYFNSIWMGGEDIAEELELYANHNSLQLYHDLPRAYKYVAIQSIEKDLLLYSLLHRGYADYNGGKFESKPVEMDGDCPFYDDGYRKIATMLYAKYVWIA